MKITGGSVEMADFEIRGILDQMLPRSTRLLIRL